MCPACSFTHTRGFPYPGGGFSDGGIMPPGATTQERFAFLTARGVLSSGGYWTCSDECAEITGDTSTPYANS